MKDEEIEKLLRAMPLKKPRHLPEDLNLRQSAGGRSRRAWRAVASLRIPVWQAAAAVLLAVLLTAGLARPRPEEPRQVTREGQAEEVEPIVPRREAEEPERMTASGAPFWRLPDRYQRMIAVAKKHPFGKDELDRRTQ